MKKYNLHFPEINKKAFNYVNNCLSSIWLSPSGNYVRLFEKELKNFTNSICVACNSGTSALHICLILAGVKDDNEVIVPTTTFIATINSVLYTKASPIFMDCDDKLSIDLDKLEQFLKNKTYIKNKSCFNIKTRKKIKALIVTHVFGDICDFRKLKRICKKFFIKIIEDAAEAIGSFDNNNKHAGTLGDYGAFSFNFNKIITTGGGGAISVKNKLEEKKARFLINQNKTDSIYFKHKDIGYNYGMSNINAAIGYSQIKNLKKIIQKKLDIFKKYKLIFKKIKDIEILQPFSKKSNYWINSAILKNKNYKTFKKIIKKMNYSGIEVRPLWYPCHLQPFLKKYQRYNIENAEKIYKQLICLPSSYFLNSKDIKNITQILIKYLK